MTTEPAEPTAAASEPVASPAAVPERSRRRPAPVARWIRGLPRATYAALLLAVIVVLLLAAVLVNPGERVGPVRAADPPVGGPVLPATRL
ncbi:MAG TPA: hypothetical protein VNQ33_05495 [Acidimicrobiales bacterium]|nr:hypothetical protein [Acidimicrobiales bacterium]